MTRLKTFAFALAVAGLAAAAPANAAENTGRSVKIEHRDLDLGKDKDVRKLERRVARALERVCGSYAMAQEMADIRRIDKCRAEARRNIEPQIASIRKRAEARLWASADSAERQ